MLFVWILIYTYTHSLIPSTLTPERGIPPLVTPFRANVVVIQFNQAISMSVDFPILRNSAVRERQSFQAGRERRRDGLRAEIAMGWGGGTLVPKRKVWGMEDILIQYGMGILKDASWRLRGRMELMAGMVRAIWIFGLPSQRKTVSAPGNWVEIQWNWKFRRKLHTPQQI